MLDVIMAAHRPNFIRMAHRALNHDASKSEPSIKGALQSAVSSIPLQGKVILSLEGGKHQDFEAAEAYLSSQSLPWQIIHSDEVTSYHECVLRGLEEAKSPHVAIIPPWVNITDQRWVQRMMWCLQKDPQALLCSTWEKTGPAKDLAPHVATPRRWPGGDIILGRRHDITTYWRMADPKEIYNCIATDAQTGGWRIWAHPGISFDVEEHEEHEPRKKTRKSRQGSSTGGNS